MRANNEVKRKKRRAYKEEGREAIFNKDQLLNPFSQKKDIS